MVSSLVQVLHDYPWYHTVHLHLTKMPEPEKLLKRRPLDHRQPLVNINVDDASLPPDARRPLQSCAAPAAKKLKVCPCLFFVSSVPWLV